MKRIKSKIIITLVGVCAGLSFIYPQLVNFLAAFVGVATLFSLLLVIMIPLCKWAYNHGNEIGEDASKLTTMFTTFKELYNDKVSLWYSHIITTFTLGVLMYNGWVFLPSLYIVLWWVKSYQLKDLVENY